MALGNTPQAKRHGREVVGRRLPDFPGRSNGGQESPGRIPERLIDPGRLQLALDRQFRPAWSSKRALTDPCQHWNGFCLNATSEIDCGKDVAVTFIVYASRGGVEITTIRLNVVAAVAKGRALIDDGWQVCIADPGGTRYQPAEFDKLASAKYTAS
jgi:hypothetical protein